jgi:hypothetical protein
MQKVHRDSWIGIHTMRGMELQQSLQAEEGE